MSRGFSGFFLPVEVIPKFAPGFFVLFYNCRMDCCLFDKEPAQTGTHCQIFIDPFGDDISSPGQGLILGSYSFFRINKGREVDIFVMAVKDCVGQGF